MYIYSYIYICIQIVNIYTYKKFKCVNLVDIYTYMYICMCVHMYVYVFIYPNFFSQERRYQSTTLCTYVCICIYLSQLFLSGAPLPINHFTDLIRAEVARAGYMEMLTHGLCSTAENFTHLLRPVGPAVALSNPANVEYEVVRTTLLPVNRMCMYVYVSVLRISTSFDQPMLYFRMFTYVYIHVCMHVF